MNQATTVHVQSKDGLHGLWLAEQPPLIPGKALIQMDNGQQVHIPLDMLQKQTDNSYYIPYNLNEVVDNTDTVQQYVANTEKTVIPIIQESLDIGKKQVSTAKVRVQKLVHEYEEAIHESLLREKVKVERVPVDHAVEGEPPAIRQEGNTLIVPVLEEVLVVEKRLILKEEIHITREQTQIPYNQNVPLRREEVLVERIENQNTNLEQTRPHSSPLSSNSTNNSGS